MSISTEIPRTERLPLPPEDVDLAGFPSRILEPGRSLYRAHHARFGSDCWHFSVVRPNSPTGRFDGPAPGRGTCYVASDPLTALAERLGFKGLLRYNDALLDQVLVSRIVTSHEYRFADLTARQSLRFWACGRELCALTPYDLTQAWARRWQEADFDGVWYAPRHNPRDRVRSLALFEGAARPAPDPQPGTALEYLARLRRAYSLQEKRRTTDFGIVEPETHPPARWASRRSPRPSSPLSRAPHG